jgi:hypothetical protein
MTSKGWLRWGLRSDEMKKLIVLLMLIEAPQVCVKVF